MVKSNSGLWSCKQVKENWVGLRLTMVSGMVASL